MTRNKPHILLITTDQQRFDTTGNSAPPFLRTPHFDHLCNEGITFNSAYVDCPLCVPSRISIMTGKSSFSHTMSDNGESSQVMGHTETLPALLRREGYQTAAIGKMHFGPQRTRHGFEEMILPADYYSSMRASGSDLQPMRHGLGQNELYPSMATVPESMTLTSWIAEQCVAYIKDRRDPGLPFFLWCSFSKPHPPLDPPEPYYSMYLNCDIPDPVYGDWADDGSCPVPFRNFRKCWSADRIPRVVLKAAKAAYYGLITQIDYNMGRVFAALQDLDLFNETLILYTSDHGELLGDHGGCAKTYFYEGSAHVPFVLRLPQSWSDRGHGTVVTDPVSLPDILPTLLAAAGCRTVPQVADGQDLIALIRGDLPRPRRYLEATGAYYSQEGTSYLGITDGRYKYIWYPDGSMEQFFDLQKDPSEMVNAALDPAQREPKERLQRELIEREKKRGGRYLADSGGLAGREIRSISDKDLRNRSWPGYHTEHYQVDVRH